MVDSLGTLIPATFLRIVLAASETRESEFQEQIPLASSPRQESAWPSGLEADFDEVLLSASREAILSRVAILESSSRPLSVEDSHDCFALMEDSDHCLAGRRSKTALIKPGKLFQRAK